MKRKAKDITSVSHDEYMIRNLRERPKFAVEYLKAALEDTEEPAVFLITPPPIIRHAACAWVSR
jgi:DNA-binding phage protein